MTGPDHAADLRSIRKRSSPSARTDLAATTEESPSPPPWAMQSANTGKDNPQAQPAPDYEFDQRIAW